MTEKIGITSMWIIVCLYIIAIFSLIPYLPRFIQFASSRFSSSSVSHFVLGTEILIALVILALALKFLIYKRRKGIFFLIIIGSFLAFSFFIYKNRPNPYELTHLPEYAILAVLMVWNLEKRKKTNPVIVKNSYFLGGLSTGLIGVGDEIYQYFLPNRYFNVYDIFLNIMGGIFGLLIIWGTKR